MKKTVVFKTPYATYNCQLTFNKYSNGRTAIQLIDEEGPVATATINIPEAKLEDDEVIIKDYSENKGMLATLVEANVVIPTDRAVRTGYVICPVCKLTKEVMEGIK